MHMGVSENRGTPKSSILIGFSIIFTINFGVSLFLETPIYNYTHKDRIVEFLTNACMKETSIFFCAHNLNKAFLETS